ncbi:Type 1 glutamine amidotransferase-like domain-containing protein [Dermacoccaceae bacterium W4C1]
MVMFLGGGGSASQEARVWQQAFEGAGSILYWPFALPDQRLPGAAHWFTGALDECGISAKVTTWESLATHHPDELTQFDVIAVGGGLTSKWARHIQDHQFATPLVDFIRAGGTYYGGSAGAILPCADITVAGLIEHDPDSMHMPGLGVLHDLGILPHADTFGDDLPAQLAKRLGHDVISLPEDSGLRVADTGFSAIGPGVARRTSPDGSCRHLPEAD